MAKLTITKGKYGVSENSVFYLDYNNGGSIYTFFIHEGSVSIEIMERMTWASNNGYEIEFKEQGEKENA